jgi:hypothetical protein
MAKKRTAQLDQEIREALAKIPKQPSLKTREQLDAEIDTILAGGLPAERHEVARALGFQYPKRPPPKKMTLTGVNLFALKKLVLEHGPVFPSRLDAVDAPHIKRTMQLGFVEPKSGVSLQLTEAGREIVADAIIGDIERESKYTPRMSELVRPDLREQVLEREKAAHQSKIDQLERVLAKLR